MNTIEEKLKEYILDRYKSIREFSQIANIPNTTLDSIFKRGIGNSSVSNIIKICKELKISVDDLADGKITPISSRTNIADYAEVENILANTKDRLIHGSDLTLGGEPINQDSIESIINAMEVGVEMANKSNKTHNKNITKTTFSEKNQKNIH